MKKILIISSLIFFTFEVVNPCTIGVISPWATDDGCPILFKNRDTVNSSQEVHFIRGERFCFIALSDAGDTTDAYAGINEAGFAIANSDVHNLPDTVSASTYLDGDLMFDALSICANADDFEALLDSTNSLPRGWCANYAVIDAEGNARVYEVSYSYYSVFDATDAGFLVRTNFAVSGTDTGRAGQFRYMRARDILESAEVISERFILQNLVRDIASEELNPYPLPFEGSYASLPYGYVPTIHTIDKYYTRAAVVINSGVMWTLLGEPIFAVAVPLWVLPVPDEVDGYSGSLLCEQAVAFQNIARNLYGNFTAVNSFAVCELLSHNLGIENWLIDSVKSLSDEIIPPESLEEVEDNLVREAYIRYSSLMPVFAQEYQMLEPALSLEAYPSPFNDECVIYYSISGCMNSSPRMEIFNIRGEKVDEIPVLAIPGGHKFIWQPDNLPSGVYLLRLSTNKSSLSKKVVYLK